MAGMLVRHMLAESFVLVSTCSFALGRMSLRPSLLLLIVAVAYCYCQLELDIGKNVIPEELKPVVGSL